MGAHREIMEKVKSSLEKLHSVGLCKTVTVGEMSKEDDDFLDSVFDGLIAFGIEKEAVLVIWKYFQDKVQTENSLNDGMKFLKNLISGEKPKVPTKRDIARSTAKAYQAAFSKCGIEKTPEEILAFIHDGCDKCEHRDECNDDCNDEK